MEGFGAMIVAHLPALFAMIAGYVLLVVEMCIPGFGLPGVLGSVLAVIGVVAMQPTPLQAFVLVVVYVALLCIALAICMHSAVRGRFAKSRFVLNDTATDANAADHNDLAYFIGKTGGIVLFSLCPSEPPAPRGFSRGHSPLNQEGAREL